MRSYGDIKQRVHEVLEPRTEGDALSRVFDLFIMTLICLSVLSLMLSTVRDFAPRWARLLYRFEVFTIAVFTIEYLARLWSCTSLPQYRHPILGRVRYIFRPYMLIDLLAIAPFYLPMVAFDFRFLRVIRLMRLFRVLKFARYSRSLNIMVRVLREQKEELVISLAVLVLLLVVSSCLIYYAENEAQPDKFSSIPQSMYWAVASLTPFKYGDVYPVTTAGQIIGAFVSFAGIGLIALPTGILGAGFIRELQLRQERRLRRLQRARDRRQQREHQQQREQQQQDRRDPSPP